MANLECYPINTDTFSGPDGVCIVFSAFYVSLAHFDFKPQAGYAKSFFS